jgi:hypothetical protein
MDRDTSYVRLLLIWLAALFGCLVFVILETSVARRTMPSVLEVASRSELIARTSDVGTDPAPRGLDGGDGLTE